LRDVASSTPYTVPLVAVIAVTSSCDAAKEAASRAENDALAALNAVPISRAPYTVPEVATIVAISRAPCTVPDAALNDVVTSRSAMPRVAAARDANDPLEAATVPPTSRVPYTVPDPEDTDAVNEACDADKSAPSASEPCTVPEAAFIVAASSAP